METSNSYTDLQNIWYELKGSTSAEYKQKIVDQNVRHFGKLYSKNGLGTAELTVVDVEKNKFLYVGKDIEKVTGVQLAEYQKGTKHIFTKAAIEHLPKLISSTLEQKKFFKNQPPSFYDNFIVNREFAYRNKKWGKQWVLHQVVKHLFNDQNQLFGVVVLQTQLNNTNHFGKFRFYIYDKTANELVPSKKAQNAKVSISKREHQVIELILDNKSSTEIAQILHISYHTVRTHRKNILRKLKCNSIIELAIEYKKYI